MIIVITGPTGVGKTKLSIAIAKKYNCEIINGDSIQIYKDLNIGSVKNIHEEYSIYEYQKDCRKLIDDITNKGKNVIIVGGTGLYIKSALYDYTLDDLNNNEQYEDKSTEELYHELKAIDKNIEIDKFNRRRIVRALNYYKVNHKSISTNNNGHKLLYDAIFIGLTMENREELYQRINERVDNMINNGLVEEVKKFYNQKIRTKPLINGIGYKELYDYFDGKISYEEAINLIKRNSRRYAKRQYTFFNHQFNIKWFNVNIKEFDKTINAVCHYIEEKNKDYISRI